MAPGSLPKKLSQCSKSRVLGDVGFPRADRVGPTVGGVAAQGGHHGEVRGGRQVQANPKSEHVTRVRTAEVGPKGLPQAGAAGVVFQSIHVAAAAQHAATLSLLETAGRAPAVVQAADQGIVHPWRDERRKIAKAAHAAAGLTVRGPAAAEALQTAADRGDVVQGEEILKGRRSSALRALSPCLQPEGGVRGARFGVTAASPR
jgi:hypothetical protein